MLDWELTGLPIQPALSVNIFPPFMQRSAARSRGREAGWYRGLGLLLGFVYVLASLSEDRVYRNGFKSFLIIDGSE